MSDTHRPFITGSYADRRKTLPLEDSHPYPTAHACQSPWDVLGSCETWLASHRWERTHIRTQGIDTNP